MKQIEKLTDPGSHVSRNIRIRAAKLARSGAVPGLDVDDIEQELRLDLIKRARNYDSSKSSFDTFADRIFSNHIATLASATKAIQAERAMQSLEAPVRKKNTTTGLLLYEVLPETAALDPVDEFTHTHGPSVNVDISKLLTALCPATRQVAITLGYLSISETALKLGINRCTVYERLAIIRQTAIRLGLDEYFEAVPTFAEARR